MSRHIISSLKINYTKFRLNSHTFLVERGRWLKPKLVYEERKCSFCKSGGIEDEYHMAMLCTVLKDLRKT